ncbi:PREDICTED: G-protein coupled receptor 35 [Myotis davidii]|uniref:G-protein coupled receptor 35 n=1 Tax=Myotis davidii TaxID=225400 RepID=L5M2V1_MYODS|nr:PREDICTED: G-protein coupled receptor 35 [Myotis davidii]ELK32657.1 G-protein coupled receptor 35 [Myotis davidii]
MKGEKLQHFPPCPQEKQPAEAPTILPPSRAPAMVPVANGPGNNSNSCSTDRGTLSQAMTIASICLILVLGLLLNSLALWVFCCRMRRWTETRIYMVNLVVADCLLLLSLPGILHTLGQGVGAQEGPLCRVLQGFYYVNTYMSMWLLTAIATDRYAALHFPLRARAWRGPRQAALTCAALWLLVIGAVALPVAWLRPGESFCFGRGHTRGPKALIFSLLLFFLPLLILSFCSCQVLRRLHREWTRAQPQATTPILKALCVVMANLATFVLCFLPLHVALLAKLVAQWMNAACPTIQRVATFVQVASRIANANCCLDAVCYYFVATEFQEEVGAVLARPRPFWGRMLGASACDHPDLGAQGEAAEERGTGVGPAQP